MYLRIVHDLGSSTGGFFFFFDLRLERTMFITSCFVCLVFGFASLFVCLVMYI